MKIELFPLEKAVVNGRSIALGAERAAVEAVLGTGEEMEQRVCYFDSCFCVEYDETGRVAFMEVSCGDPESTVTATICGEDVTAAGADRVLQILTEKNCGEVENENGYAYTFYNLSVGVYREITPADCEELIEEMKANGDPVEGNPDVEADLWKASHWATIGIGVRDYYRCV